MSLKRCLKIPVDFPSSYPFIIKFNDKSLLILYNSVCKVSLPDPPVIIVIII